MGYGEVRRRVVGIWFSADTIASHSARRTTVQVRVMLDRLSTELTGIAVTSNVITELHAIIEQGILA